MTLRKRLAVLAYVLGGRRPWSRGYVQYKDRFVEATLADRALLERFARAERLPPAFGQFLDERVVEYPWLLARLGESKSRLLDAGSALNHSYLLAHPRLAAKELTIVTLAPEGRTFDGVSYVYEDLRALSFPDASFDEVATISTLEHVGMDNTMYSKNPAHREKRPDDVLVALRQLNRVLRTGGKLYLTVPFGKPEDHGWFRQFDARELDRLIAAFEPSRVEATFFRYSDGGWNVSSREDCGDAVGFDIHATRYMDPKSTKGYDSDFAAASRAIAALELWK